MRCPRVCWSAAWKRYRFFFALFFAVDLAEVFLAVAFLPAAFFAAMARYLLSFSLIQSIRAAL